MASAFAMRQVQYYKVETIANLHSDFHRLNYLLGYLRPHCSGVGVGVGDNYSPVFINSAGTGYRTEIVYVTFTGVPLILPGSNLPKLLIASIAAFI